MISNHLGNGIDTARMVWSRLPNTEDGELDSVGLLKKNDSSGVGSLDYEVIENFAYREEQERRGKWFVGYQVVLKWFVALRIGIDHSTSDIKNDLRLIIISLSGCNNYPE
ncbi:Chloride channel protein CLC-d-like protein [Drosera capensis]